MAKPLVGDLGIRSNGTSWLPLVPGIDVAVDDPRVRGALLLLDWEREAPASSGPLPHGPSVLHSARACMAPQNQPTGQLWVTALVAATVRAWEQAA